MPGIWTTEDELNYAKHMKSLAIMFGRDLNKDLLALYRDELGDLDGDMATDGLQRCVRESKFWPSVGEVRRRAGAENVELMHQRIETRDDRAAALLAKGVMLTGIGG